MNRFGIRHGRILSHSKNQTFFFKSNKWKNEFEEASKLGFDLIELSINKLSIDVHPLMKKKGRIDLIKLIKKTKININHISFDIFMDDPLFNFNKNRMDLFYRLISYVSELKIKYVQLPLMGNSSLMKKSDRGNFIQIINNILPELEKNSIVLLLESDLNAKDLLALLNEIKGDIGITYDTGNSLFFGYDIQKEILLLKDYIKKIDIKDSSKKRYNIPLGFGDVDFDLLFQTMKSYNFFGDYIFETPFYDVFDSNIENYFQFISKSYNKDRINY